ncbi:MAG: hypothetical protein ACRD82_08105, partial [Blastocatellia bacterium]
VRFIGQPDVGADLHAPIMFDPALPQIRPNLAGRIGVFDHEVTLVFLPLLFFFFKAALFLFLILSGID